MKYKIGVFGSDLPGLNDIVPKAKALGRALAEHSDSVIVITGGGSGLPYTVAQAAAEKGSEVWGYSPVFDAKSQKEYAPNDDPDIYAKLIYVSADFEFANNDSIRKKYRNVLSTGSCDAGIIISGRWGSLNEFTNLVDMGKLVGVLTKTGGVADILPDLNKKISKEGQGKIIFSDNPVKLVEEILSVLSTKK